MKISDLRYGLFALCVCALVSCSSAPPPTDEVFETRNRAAEYAEFGHRYFEAARYDKALEFYRLSLENNIAVDNEPGIVKSQNSIGKVYMVTGQLDRAAELFLWALDTSHTLGDLSLIAMSASHLGEYYMEIGDTPRAIALFTEAVDSADTLPENDRAILLHNAGTAYRRSGDLDRALGLFNDALDINDANGRLAEAASNRYMIASVYAKQGDYQTALEYALAALENDKKAENSVGIAKDHRALGLITEQLGSENTAYQHYEKAFTIYSILNIEAERKKTLEDLLRLATLLGLDSEAENYQTLLAQSGAAGE